MSEINKALLNEINSLFPGLSLTQDIPWKKLTTTGVGQACPLMAKPENSETLSKFLAYCSLKKIDILPIGNGSNIIGTDENINLIVIKLDHPNYKAITFHDNNYVICGPNVSIYRLVQESSKRNLTGLENIKDIPGSIAGSLRTNAGRNNVSISDFITELNGFDFDGNPWSTENHSLQWGYRSSSIPNNVIITSITFRMQKQQTDIRQSLIYDTTESDKHNYHKTKNAGCFFRNPPQGYSASKLIDIANCKGMTAGDAEICVEHANFMINKNNATEQNILDLAIKVRGKVLEDSGIYLEPEVVFANRQTYKKLKSALKPIDVVILKGGSSREREVSLESAEGVSKALNDAGYNVVELDITEPEIPDSLDNFSGVVFPVLHGGFGENGDVQKKSEEKSIKYVGCSSSVSKIILDKIKTKEFFINNNILTPEYAVLKDGETSFPDNLTLPVVVKPPNEGSTFGVTIVRNMEQWDEALKKASGDISGEILVEQYIKGLESTVGIIGGKPLQLVHISFPGELYDYDAKYTHKTGETIYISPPDKSLIPIELQTEIKKIASNAYNKISARHMLRVDFIISENDHTPYFIEMNTIPGFTSSSLLPKSAEADGISYIQLCGKLIQMAYRETEN